MVNPKITEPKTITLAGVSFYGDPFDTHAGWDEDNQIGLLWKRLFALIQHRPDLKPLLKTKNYYEVHLYGHETREKGLFEVFVGVEYAADKINDLPPEMLVKNLPSVQYAIFTFAGEQINSDWEKLLQDWMRGSTYQSGGTYNFQFYDERFKGVDRLAESVLDVYVPIKKAA